MSLLVPTEEVEQFPEEEELEAVELKGNVPEIKQPEDFEDLSDSDTQVQNRRNAMNIPEPISEKDIAKDITEIEDDNDASDDEAVDHKDSTDENTDEPFKPSSLSILTGIEASSLTISPLSSFDEPSSFKTSMMDGYNDEKKYPWMGIKLPEIPSYDDSEISKEFEQKYKIENLIANIRGKERKSEK